MSAITAIVGVCVAIALAVWSALRVPNAVPATAKADLFSAERAMRHVREIAQRPHPSGGEDHPRVRAYLLRELGALGLAAQIQEATGVSTRYASAGRVWNILARVAGRTRGGSSVLLMAHYDGVPPSPGAGDDASGVAVLLETLRAIRATDTLAHDVIALFTDGEEAGLLGAAAFVREHPWAKDVAVTLNFEGRGTRGPSLMFETGPGNLDIVRVLRGVGGGRATSLSTAVYRSLPNDTDLSELGALERPAMNFAFIGGVQRYHSAEDDVAHLDARTLQHQGDQALALTRSLASGALPRPRTGDAVFFNLPLLGLIFYPEALAPWLAIIALLLPIGAVVVARRRERRLLFAVTLGVAVTIAATIVAGMIGFGAASGIQALHVSIASGAPEWSGAYALAITAVALAVSAAAYALGRRWGSAFGLHSGALIALGALGLWMAIAMPGASFLFTWPTLLFGAAVIADAVRPATRVHDALIWLATIVTIFVLAPTLYLMVCVALGVNAVGAAALALLTALGATLLWTQFESIAWRVRWAVPAGIATIGLVCFVVGTITVRTNRDHPAGTSLIYAVDADSGSAWLSGFGFTPSARVWLSRALQASGSQRADTVPAWVQRNADRRNAYTAAMSIPALAPSTATILSDSSEAGNRHVTLRITPSRGTRSIGLRAEHGSILSARVDGRSIDTTRYRRQLRQWTLNYTAPADSGFLLTLTFPHLTSLTIGILSRRIGIPALQGIRIPQRPEGIIALHDGDASIVYHRFTIDRR